MSINYFSFATPIGYLNGQTSKEQLVQLTFAHTAPAHASPHHAFSKHVEHDILRYFDNPKHDINIPYTANGTAFQQRVWQALLTIPPGQTQTYGEIAKRLQTSPRAVGMACRTNPLPLIIPCHRVVASDGMGGFIGKTAGESLTLKLKLLTHEKAIPSETGTKR